MYETQEKKLAGIKGCDRKFILVMVVTYKIPFF